MMISRTLAVAVVSFGVTSGTACAGVAVFDPVSEEYSDQIHLIAAVKAIDFDRHTVTVQYPGSDAQEHTFETLPCPRKPYVKLVIPEPGTGWKVFTPISSCFEPEEVKEGTQK